MLTWPITVTFFKFPVYVSKGTYVNYSKLFAAELRVKVG